MTRKTKIYPRMTQGEMDVLDERKRQQHVEGYGDSFDDEINDDRELAAAAASYAFGAQYDDYTRKSQTNQDSAGRPTRIYDMWPASWDWDQYKPTTSRRDLVKAAALCIAEIDRLDRKVARDHNATLDSAATQYLMEKEYGVKN
jgi:hypothetical protein